MPRKSKDDMFPMANDKAHKSSKKDSFKTPGMGITLIIGLGGPMASECKKSKGSKLNNFINEDKEMPKSFNASSKARPSSTGSQSAPRNKSARSNFALGGAAKVRHQEATKEGKEIKGKSKKFPIII
jgi:hypothetical protein